MSIPPTKKYWHSQPTSQLLIDGWAYCIRRKATHSPGLTLSWFLLFFRSRPTVLACYSPMPSNRWLLRFLWNCFSCLQKEDLPKTFGRNSRLKMCMQSCHSRTVPLLPLVLLRRLLLKIRIIITPPTSEVTWKLTTEWKEASKSLMPVNTGRPRLKYFGLCSLFLHHIVSALFHYFKSTVNISFKILLFFNPLSA